ncbi:MAG: ABC transporter permease [Actinomycetales bacterium]
MGPGYPMSGVVARRRRMALARFVVTYRRDRAGMAGLTVLAVFVLVALLAPILIPADALDVTKAQGERFGAPSVAYPMGTDDSGRSMLLLLAYGTRISLTVGLAATVVAMVIGTAVGILAGHFRGPTSHVLVGVTDWFLVIPFLPLAIVLATVLGPSTLNLIIVIGITSWAGTARLIRAQTLSIEGRPYLERAKALGAGNWHQMTRHVLPNVFPLVLANTTLTVAIVILSETTLSFLGLGDPLAPSWGALLDRAFSSGAVSRGAWWFVLPPGICVVLVVMGFTLVGRAIERILDPRGGLR